MNSASPDSESSSSDLFGGKIDSTRLLLFQLCQPFPQFTQLAVQRHGDVGDEEKAHR